ncbi:MAG: ABC transporter permease [Planctomycetota bacterium]
MSGFAKVILSPFADIGRELLLRVKSLGAMTNLLIDTLYWTVIGPFTGKTRFRETVFPLMYQIGIKSLFICCLVTLLVGAILVFQTADQFERFGAKTLVPTMICLSIVRELGPLMTAIVLAGRVGAAFTAGLGSMVINEEVLALRTMGINPVGYLVAPRFIAMCIMVPCLSIYSYLLGNLGGFLVGVGFYNLPAAAYINKVGDALDMTDMVAGAIKSVFFGAIICMVACHNALTVRGGPEGVGRNTMISVVNSLVAIIVFDLLFGLLMARHFYTV